MHAMNPDDAGQSQRRARDEEVGAVSATNSKTTITAVEQARRRRAVDKARHSTEMEGGRSSCAHRDAQEAYVRGKIEVDELIELSQRN